MARGLDVQSQTMTDMPVNRPLSDRLERFADRLTGFLAVIAVAGLLMGAAVVVADVLMRWLFAGGIVALNEVMGQMFAIAVAATLPAGVSRRVNLSVDLLASQFGPRISHLLSVLSSLALTLFLAALTTYIWSLALRFLKQGRETMILEWPIAPTYVLAAVAMGLALLTQVLLLWKDCLRAPKGTPLRTTPFGMALVAALLIACFLGGVWAALDMSGLQSAVMSKPGMFTALAFILLWIAVLCQIPLAAATGLIGLAGTAIMLSLPSAGRVFANDAMEFLTNWQVATLPMFLMMGSFAVAAGISDDIYRLASALLGRVRAGLAYTTVLGCACFGAVSGSSVATAATFGRIALPEMRRRNYESGFASGVVAAGGTLGSLVPPSGAIILFALLTEQSIGILFVAAMMPALLALGLYFLTIWLLVTVNPGLVPERVTENEPLGPALIGALPVVLLFGVVIGGLYGGIFTATESAAFGAMGAFVMALARGKLSRARLLEVMRETTATTALIYGLIFGALIFSFFVNLGDAPAVVARTIGALDLSPLLILSILLVFYLILGAIMDSFAVMVITVPVVTPIVIGLGFDVFHWGVLMLVVVEIGLISPPFGINLFVLKSLMPDQPISRIMKGVLPFLVADLIKVALLLAIPALALWLPGTMN